MRLRLILALFLVPTLNSAADEQPRGSKTLNVTPQPPARGETIPVVVKLDLKPGEKGIRVLGPAAISAADAGKEITVTVVVGNFLGEEVFLRVAPIWRLATTYQGPNGERAGSGAVGKMDFHLRQFALLSSNDVAKPDEMTRHASRKLAFPVRLPATAKRGGHLRIRIPLSGYFKANGRPWSGEIQVSTVLE
jgi:hypothetical protein